MSPLMHEHMKEYITRNNRTRDTPAKITSVFACTSGSRESFENPNFTDDVFRLYAGLTASRGLNGLSRPTAELQRCIKVESGRKLERKPLVIIFSFRTFTHHKFRLRSFIDLLRELSWRKLRDEISCAKQCTFVLGGVLGGAD